MKFLAIGLTLILTIAKLMHLINWSWWIVFAPVGIWLGLVLLVIIGALAIAFLKAIL